METQSTDLTRAAIDPATQIGMVTLRVADLARSLRFYAGVLGFQPIERTPGKLLLGGQDSRPLLELQALPGALPAPRRATGLYHVAILLPSRADLGRALIRMVEAGWEIGQSDHLVSEALYLSDPDGNGLEVYRDRPRDTWHWKGGMVQMAIDPLDLPGLIETGRREAEPWTVLPVGTRVGHIHLRVGDIPQARRFYHTMLGFDVIAQMAGALFVSAGGYHHHIGLNTWESQGAGPTPANAAGLETFVIELPNAEALAGVRERLASHGIAAQEEGGNLRIADPWGNPIRLEVMPAPEA